MHEQPASTPDLASTPDPDFDKVETVITVEVPPGYRERERLDVYLTAKIANATRAKVQAAVHEGRVDVNGSVETRVSRPVVAGDVLTCRVMRLPPLDVRPEAIPIEVVYEDDVLLIVNKPAGLVVHPAYGHRSGTLVNALLHHVGAGALRLEHLDGDAAADEASDVVGSDDADGDELPHGLSAMEASVGTDGRIVARPGIVHRIDKDTSGLLVVAKTDVSHARLAAQFANHSIEREYVALVWGVPLPSERRIETALGRDPRDRKKMAVVRAGTGKNAVTHLRVVETFGEVALVAVRLETGRTHQIRVHARHLGHPLVGDVTYGGDTIPRNIIGSRRAMYQNVLTTLGRQALHARLLGFRHPATGEAVVFESPLPDDMASVLDRLRRAVNSARNAVRDIAADDSDAWVRGGQRPPADADSDATAHEDARPGPATG